MRWTIVDVKGFDSTIGYTQWANKPAEQDAAVRFLNLSLPKTSPIPPFPATHTSYPPARIGRLDAPRGRCRNLHQDKRPPNASRLRELQPPLGPHDQSMVARTHPRWLLRRRGRAARGGRGGARRRLGCWGEYTHSVGVLWDLWS